MVTYRLPPRCCRCMGSAETHATVNRSQHMGTYQIVHSVQVPLCRSCKLIVEGIPFAVWGLGALIITVISASGVGWGPQNGIGVRIFGGLFIGLSLGGLPAYVVMKLCAPAKLRANGDLEFDNQDYQKIFKEANL